MKPSMLIGLILCATALTGAASEKKTRTAAVASATTTTQTRTAAQATTSTTSTAPAGYIGLGLANVTQDTPKLRDTLGLNAGVLAKLRKTLGLSANQQGALVFNVMPGSPAAKARIMPGDLIIAADSKTIWKPQDLTEYVMARKIGSTVKLAIVRPQANGGAPKRINLAIQVARRPTPQELQRTTQSRKGGPVKSGPEALGVSVAPASENGRQGLRITQVQAKSAAERAGLRQGDFMLEVNQKPVRTSVDVEQAMKAKPDRPQLITLRRQGKLVMLVVELQ